MDASASAQERIIQYYEQAVAFAATDPSGSVNNLRKGGEAMCKYLLDYNMYTYAADTTLAALIAMVNDNELWPDPRMNPLMRSILQIANYGSHYNKTPFVRADIIPCILNFRRLIYFLLGPGEVHLSDIELGNLKNMEPLAHEEPFNIATSDLIVIEGMTRNWRAPYIYQAFGFKEDWKRKPWNDEILRELSSGDLDMAIYNKQRILRYNETCEEKDRLHIVRDICSSMGGRNFYILASLKGCYTHLMSLEEFKASLGPQTMIAVSVHSDRYDNFLKAVGLSEDELKARGVTIIDNDTDTGLDCFKFNPNILLIGGQDVRMWAEKTNEYIEVLNYESFEAEDKKAFYLSSVNSIVLGEQGYQKIVTHHAERMVDHLIMNFYRNTQDPDRNETLIKTLSETVKTKGADEETIRYIIQRIMFETYRVQL